MCYVIYRFAGSNLKQDIVFMSHWITTTIFLLVLWILVLVIMTRCFSFPSTNYMWRKEKTQEDKGRWEKYRQQAFKGTKSESRKVNETVKWVCDHLLLLLVGGIGSTQLYSSVVFCLVLGCIITLLLYCDVFCVLRVVLCCCRSHHNLLVNCWKSWSEQFI